MIEQDLARIADALEQVAFMAEQIAYVMANPLQITAGEPHPEGTESRPLPTDIDTKAAPTGNADDADHLKRENLKCDLRALGVPFKDSARTGTLQKLLDDKLAELPHPETEGDAEIEPPQEIGDPVGAEIEPPQEIEEPVGAETATRDDVRMALIELSAAKGKDAALAMLRKVGGAEKLSDVAEDRYAELTKACKEQSNG